MIYMLGKETALPFLFYLSDYKRIEGVKYAAIRL